MKMSAETTAQVKTMKKLLLLAIASLLLPLSGVGSASAQTAPTLSEQTLKETQRSGSLYDQSGGGLNVMQLIHNANLRGNTTPEQFQSRQQENLNEAVEAFRKRNSSELKIDFSRQAN
jgi:hypothetical protein